ncbi:glucosidase 2 subunit beta [Lucilia cuprina]|uniref:glucosidase 2 subunit beta n=1 Tax=Lucilia cuprina TaxID=7375 RepID=UPI001F06D818|nr:glucosidase 2 subunit beta [Lucilia cuprina]
MLPSKKLKFAQVLCTLLFTFFTTTSLWTITLADVPRPRGVSLSKATLYKPRSDDTWLCLDGTKTLKFVQINDDYCDCDDGSDEPGTSACSEGTFHCANRGHRPQDVPSSRVNDGICDCCDGSDEYMAEGMCANTCIELGKVEQEQRKSQAEMYKKGAAKRSEMVTRGKQLKAEREKRRAELEARRQEQEALKAEKEQLKKQAEAAETEAINFFKEQQKERDAADASNNEPSSDDSLRNEATDNFMRYDSNKDGFIEITELQRDLQLDRDRNGVVDTEEAKYFLDERERIDLENFIALSWPRIKTMQMIAQGLFTPPGGEEHNDEVAELLNEEQRGDQKPEEDNEQPGQDATHFEGDDEEEEEVYEDDDIGAGSVEAERNPEVEYDPETQRFINMANEARNALSEVERAVREIEHEIKEIDDQNAKDYGPNDEYATLEGECYNFEEREYVYKLCPFERASQQPRSGGSEITLGRWDQWLHEGESKYAKQKYAHGASCWNGPQRSVVVHLKCALESRITGVSEPNRCEYYFDFETPAACDEEAFAAAEQRFKDEL